MKIPLPSNSNRSKSKRIQCKDIPTAAILTFLATLNNQAATFYPLDVSNSIWKSLETPGNVPRCVLRKKMENLIRKGLVEGCACGCRGDFRLTFKGMSRLQQQ